MRKPRAILAGKSAEIVVEEIALARELTARATATGAICDMTEEGERRGTAA